MSIEFSLNAEQMYRACYRFSVGLSDGPMEPEPVVIFNVHPRGLQILIGQQCSRVPADVWAEGTVWIPVSVLRSMVRTLPYFGARKIQIRFSEGMMRVHSTVFHHGQITLANAGTQRGKVSLENRVLSHQVA